MQFYVSFSNVKYFNLNVCCCLCFSSFLDHLDGAQQCPEFTRNELHTKFNLNGELDPAKLLF